MFTFQTRVILSAMIACSTLAVAVGAATAAEDKVADKKKETILIAVLKSEAQSSDKAMACKQLALCGTKDAVPALMSLLADEHLAGWARIALEVIPDPAVDEALRSSLGKLNGRCLIGVINSIGFRHDFKAVEALAAKLRDNDVEVASVAAVALGHIGGDAAAMTLEGALSGTAPAVRSAVAEGCVLCAEKQLAAGKSDEAARICDLVRKTDLPKQRIREATRGAILARKADGVPLLVELLQSADKQMFNLALTVARELPGKGTTDALVSELSKASPERQSLLILAIADHGDATAMPAVLQAAKTGPDVVKVTVIKVLKRLGNVSSVPLLLEAAADENASLAATATEALASLRGKEVDAAIADRLPKADGKVRKVLLQLVGDRVLTAAIPDVIKAASDADLQVRLQALTALGYAVEFKDIAVLIGRVAATPENAEEAQAAEKALKVACQRMSDTETCAAKLVAAMESAKVPARVNLLEALTALGGKRALEAVGAAAANSDTDIQDAGSRLLGEWMTLDAAPVLVNLAKTSSDTKFEVRAVRAYIRLLRQFPMRGEDRAEMCRTAMAISKRDAEKKLVLEVLQRYPSLDALQLACATAKIASLKDDASKTALAIAKKIRGKSPQVQELLAQLNQELVKIEILKAEYGAGATMKDVTDTLRKGARGFPLIVLEAATYNDAFGGDPAPGTIKELKIEYRMNGKSGKARFTENAEILLPKP
ncbi:MAG: HEAT repeat domain-containing protein [Planctomycetota bacterium]